MFIRQTSQHYLVLVSVIIVIIIIIIKNECHSNIL